MNLNDSIANQSVIQQNQYVLNQIEQEDDDDQILFFEEDKNNYYDLKQIDDRYNDQLSELSDIQVEDNESNYDSDQISMESRYRPGNQTIMYYQQPQNEYSIRQDNQSEGSSYNINHDQATQASIQSSKSYFIDPRIRNIMDNTFSEKIDFIVHDGGVQKIFFLKVSPTTIYCNLQDDLFISDFLNDLDSFLRDSLNDSCCIKNFSDKRYGSDRRVEFLFIEEENLQNQNKKNQLPTRIIVRAGIKERNTQKYLDDLLSKYSDVDDSKQLETLVSFISYWGDKRQIINDKYLNDYALYIMIINFCQKFQILPYLQNNKEIAEKVEQVNYKLRKDNYRRNQLGDIIQEKQLNTEDVFDMDIYSNDENNKRRRIQQLYALNYPKSQDKIEEIRNNFQQNRQYSPGMLVYKFFCFMAHEIPDMKDGVTIDGTTMSMRGLAGYSVFNPILKNNLTKNLCHPSESYVAVKQEFERAANCISERQGLSLKDLCSRYKE